ncbi:MAG: 6-carboxytetrahydropterin synthase [Coleofasciculus sp. S288]|nr:6-carboxytetrahydropterin synthase [Coleofasciculus sp. S288]
MASSLLPIKQADSFQNLTPICRREVPDIGKQQDLISKVGRRCYIQPLLDGFLDHHYLNETTGLVNPTSEAIAKWIFEKLEKAGLPGLYAVEIRETCTSGARYTARPD